MKPPYRAVQREGNIEASEGLGGFLSTTTGGRGENGHRERDLGHYGTTYTPTWVTV